MLELITGEIFFPKSRVKCLWLHTPKRKKADAQYIIHSANVKNCCYEPL